MDRNRTPAGIGALAVEHSNGLRFVATDFMPGVEGTEDRGQRTEARDWRTETRGLRTVEAASRRFPTAAVTTTRRSRITLTHGAAVRSLGVAGSLSLRPKVERLLPSPQPQSSAAQPRGRSLYAALRRRHARRSLGVGVRGSSSRTLSPLVSGFRPQPSGLKFPALSPQSSGRSLGDDLNIHFNSVHEAVINWGKYGQGFQCLQVLCIRLHLHLHTNISETFRHVAG